VAHVDLPFDPTKPADGDLLRDGDDQIRKIVRQIIEALTDLVVDPTADPLVLKASALGASTIPDGSITAAKLAASISLRRIILITATKTLSLAPGASEISNVAALGAVPGDIVIPSWGINNSHTSVTMIHGIIDTAGLVNMSYFNTSTALSVSLTAAPLNLLLVGQTVVGTP